MKNLPYEEFISQVERFAGENGLPYSPQTSQEVRMLYQLHLESKKLVDSFFLGQTYLNIHSREFFSVDESFPILEFSQFFSSPIYSSWRNSVNAHLKAIISSSDVKESPTKDFKLAYDLEGRIENPCLLFRDPQKI